MKKIIALCLFLHSASAFSADIQFRYKGELVSLLESYENLNGDPRHDPLYEIFNIVNLNDGQSLDGDVMCIDIDDKDNTLIEITDLSNYMDGPFEEVSIIAGMSSSFEYPISIELYDMPNEQSLGKVQVQFCK